MDAGLLAAAVTRERHHGDGRERDETRDDSGVHCCLLPSVNGAPVRSVGCDAPVFASAGTGPVIVIGTLSTSLQRPLNPRDASVCAEVAHGEARDAGTRREIGRQDEGDVGDVLRGREGERRVTTVRVGAVDLDVAREDGPDARLRAADEIDCV